MQRNFEGLAAAYNMLRLKVGNGTLSYKELYEQLRKVGISSGIVQKMITHGYIKSEKDLSSKTNKYSLNIVNKLQIENLFKERRKDSKRWNKRKENSNNNVESLISQLEKQGYKILKPRFDEQKFKEENPELYKKYLVYE